MKAPDLALAGEQAVVFSYPDEFTTVTQRGNAITRTHQDPTRSWMTSVEMQAPAPSGTGTTLSTLSFSHDVFGRTLSQTFTRNTSKGRTDGVHRFEKIFIKRSHSYILPFIIFAGLKPRGIFILPLCIACNCFIIFCISRNWLSNLFTS